MATEQEYYKKLMDSRSRRSKDLHQGGQAKKNAELSASQRRLPMKSQLALARARSSRKKAKKNPKDIAKTAKNLAGAFTAIDLSKDAMQFVVIAVSIIADLVTLIPVVGNFLAIVFSIIIWTLYAISGHLRRKPGRKIAVTAIADALETFGFVIDALPFFTISALINYWFALADRKSKQQAK